jgi:uncharacterized protein YdhG (YjbR/CyaY superfamily)
MARPAFASVDDYIAAQPKAARAKLAQVRATLRNALPGATEGISYQIPVYKNDGVMVLYFAGFADHFSIYPATERLVEALGKAGAGLLHGKATLRFSLAQDVPTRLITRIAKLRAAEAAERKAGKAPTKKRAQEPKAVSVRARSRKAPSPSPR